MKHKFITLLLLLTAAVAALSFQAGAADVVDEFAEDMRNFEPVISVPVRDCDALMEETFKRYPELCCYYDGCSYSSTAEGLTLTMRYRNTDKDPDDFIIVDSEDELMAAIGLLMCDLGDGVDVLLTNGYEVDADAIYDRLYADYYLIAQGLNFRFNDGVTWDTYGITYYNITLFYCDGTPKETVRYWRTETEKKVLELAGTLFAQDMPDYQKLYLIHDYLVDTCVYDMDDINVEREWVNHVAYGCLCEGSGVCQSYAEATRMLCEAAGIPCYFVPGDAGGAHSWNCVQLGGEWYLLDTTWDDPVTNDGSDVKRYDYFLVTSDQLRQDHTWEEGEYPSCTATTLNYDRVMELMAADTNTYTDYSTENVRTEAMLRAELEALLGGVEEAVAEPEAREDDLAEEPEEDGEVPADEGEEPADEPEGDDVVEPDDGTVEPQEPTTDPDDPEEPDDEPVLPDELKPVVTIDKEKQKLNSRYEWIVVLIILALTAGVTVIVVRCIANSRVMSARSERKVQRDARVRNSVRTRRRF